MRYWLFILLISTYAEARVWKDVYEREFEAELVSVHGSDLVMAMPGGRKFVMKLDGLCASSQQAVLAASRKPAGAAFMGSNIGAGWPREVRHGASAMVKVVKEDRNAGRYLYESPHYRFRSNVRLSQEVLRNFSVMFETTYQFCGRLPLGMKKSTGGGRFEILLFETVGQYIQAGGMPGSAGCFVPGRNLVMTPLSSLGVVPYSGGYRLDRRQLNTVLIHEIVHQLTPSAYYKTGARGWFSEGLAEYVAASPYRWGYFQVDDQGNAAKAYVTGFGSKGRGGRALGTEIRVPLLRDFMTMSYEEFVGRRANHNYGFSLLLVHYFFHMDAQGKGRRLSAFLRALHSGERGDALYRHLLAGRSFAELEKDIARAWLGKGVSIRFGS